MPGTAGRGPAECVARVTTADLPTDTSAGPHTDDNGTPIMITRGRTDVVLRVDPIACRAHGLCAEELPEAITLDEWGYPIMPTGPLPPELPRRARSAAAACPVLALRLEQRPR